VHSKRRLKLLLPPQVQVQQLYAIAAEQGVQIRRLQARRDSLEDIFLKAMEERDGSS
jgi:ABC-2 type transport system ATP-binding protein